MHAAIKANVRRSARTARPLGAATLTISTLPGLIAALAVTAPIARAWAQDAPTAPAVTAPAVHESAFIRGMRAFAASDWPTATTLLTQAITEEPKNGDALTALGYVEAQVNGHYDLAISYLERASAIPDRLEPESALSNLAVALSTKPGSTHADRERAIGYLQQAADVVDPEPRTKESALKFSDPKTPNPVPHTIQMELGGAAFKEGELEKAATAFRRATVIDETDPAGWRSLGIVLYNLKQDSEAIAALRRATAILDKKSSTRAEDAQVYAVLGNLEMKHDDRAAAQRDLDKAYSINKNDAVVQSNRAKILSDQGKHAEAAAAYGAAADIQEAGIKASSEGATPEQRRLLGNLLYHQGLELSSANHTAEMGSQAVDAYKKSIAADPDNVEAMINVGALLYGSGRYDDAIGYYDKALAKKPQPKLALLAWKNLAIAYSKKHDAEQADRAWHEVSKLDPNNTDALSSKAASLVEANPIDDAAIPLYKKLARARPEDAQPLIGLGLLYERQVPYVSTAAAKQARLLAAMQCFSEAIKRGTTAASDPVTRDDANALTATAYNNRGVIHEQIGEIAQAKADYKKALELKPDFDDAHKNLIRFTEKPAPVVKPKGHRS